MFSKEQARYVAERFLCEKYPTEFPKWVMHAQCLEKEYGWIFFYESRKFMEGGPLISRLAGNGPILVTKLDGVVVQIGTAEPLEYYLAPFENEKALREKGR